MSQQLETNFIRMAGPKQKLVTKKPIEFQNDNIKLNTKLKLKVSGG